jgi:hypothetical protein
MNLRLPGRIAEPPVTAYFVTCGSSFAREAKYYLPSVLQANQPFADSSRGVGAASYPRFA